MFREKRSANDQTQKTGEGSQAYQAGRDINITEQVDYVRVKEIFMDLFKANAYELTVTAGTVARGRAEEVLERYISRIESEKPDIIKQLAEPDIQYALISTQKAYARTGDKELSEVLVDILVDRTKSDKRDLLQVVLNEALEVAPKLTPRQFDALSLLFLLRHTVFKGINDFRDVLKYFEDEIIPFGTSLPEGDAFYTHLQYAGCGRIETGVVNLEGVNS